MPISLKELLWPLSFTTLIITSSGNSKTLAWRAWIKHHVDSYYLCITIQNYFLVSVENFNIHTHVHINIYHDYKHKNRVKLYFKKITWQIWSLWMSLAPLAVVPVLLQLLSALRWWVAFEKKKRCFKPTVSTNQTEPRMESDPPGGSNVSTYLGWVSFAKLHMPPSAWSNYTYRTWFHNIYVPSQFLTSCRYTRIITLGIHGTGIFTYIWLIFFSHGKCRYSKYNVRPMDPIRVTLFTYSTGLCQTTLKLHWNLKFRG